ncbi:hypothetical protein [Sandaracinus amylolyticus]|uniref:hypothetical protein n=1 Tax=Sandaracinus amylolyticus TaxID=927083 RepID=UPI001F427192|nr:hypothetical protein [Sandaracinus amylolyticus]
MISIAAGAAWRRAPVLGGLLALVSLLAAAATVGIATMSRDAPVRLADAERLEPRVEVRDATRWLVQPALQLELLAPNGLHRSHDVAPGTSISEALRTAPERVEAWRWTDAAETRNLFLFVQAERGDEDTQRTFVTGVIGGLRRQFERQLPDAIASEHERGPLDRTLSFRGAGDAGVLARVFVYELDDRFILTMVLATAQSDLQALDRILASARHSTGAAGTPAVAAAPSPTAIGPRVATAVPIAGAGAFDLIADVSGTSVAWADPADQGGVIRALELGPEGEPIGAARELVATGAHVRELAVARRGDRLALAWITTDGRSGRAHAAVIEGPSGEASPIAIGAARATGAARGDVAIASLADGAFVVATRADSGIALSVIGGARRRIEPIALASPCEAAIVGAFSTDDGALLGLCGGTPGAEEWILARIDGATAEIVERRALGCADVRLSSAGGGRAIARCGDAPVSTALDGTDARPASSEPVACEGERPRLGAALEGATDDLEGMLPSSVAAPGSRAAWTGRALLVATRLGPELVIQRRQCQSGALLRTDL